MMFIEDKDSLLIDELCRECPQQYCCGCWVLDEKLLKILTYQIINEIIRIK